MAHLSGTASKASRARSALMLIATPLLIIGSVAACSSNASDSPATSAESPTMSAWRASASPGNGGIAAAKALVAAAEAPVSFIAPGGPISVKAQAGKTLWIVSADLSIPFHQNIANAFCDAAQTAGLKCQRFDGHGSTSTQAQGIQQAIAARAAGIALISIDVKFVKTAVSDANAAHIPVIGILNTDAHAQPQAGTAGEATIDYVKSGELMAAYAIANQDGPVHALYFSVPEFYTVTFEINGVKQAFQKYCSSSCTLDNFTSEIATFKTQTQTETQSQLLAHPNTNWILSSFDAQALFQIPVIKSAGYGSKVRLTSINAVTANLDFIKQGNVQVADIGNSNGWLGWAAVDRLLRALSGQPPAVSEVPIRLFDQQNLQGKDTGNEDQLFGTDFKTHYKALWGVS